MKNRSIRISGNPRESAAKKAACRKFTAPFGAVILIKRGGLPLRTSCLALILLLCGCASLTKTNLKTTDTIRDDNIAEKLETSSFLVTQQPNADNPNLAIAVIQQKAQARSFQRRYIEERMLKPGARPLLLLAGAAIAAGAYYNFYEQGYVVVGRDLMGLGALFPIVTGALGSNKEVGEQWKWESKLLPSRMVRAWGTPLLVSASDSTWQDTTDIRGLVIVDISRLADMPPSGQPLKIRVTLQDDTTQSVDFSTPASVVAVYRTPPPALVPEVEVAEFEPEASLPIDWKDLPTIAILNFDGIGVSAQEAMILTNRLSTHMVQLGRYQVIERGQMEQIMREQDFQLVGCTSNECAVEIGQMIGAQQMLAGSFGKFGNLYTIDMRIIDVATGGILRTTSYDVQGEAERLLTVGLAEAARRIAGFK